MVYNLKYYTTIRYKAVIARACSCVCLFYSHFPKNDNVKLLFRCRFVTREFYFYILRTDKISMRSLNIYPGGFASTDSTVLYIVLLRRRRGMVRPKTDAMPFRNLRKITKLDEESTDETPIGLTARTRLASTPARNNCLGFAVKRKQKQKTKNRRDTVTELVTGILRSFENLFSTIDRMTRTIVARKSLSGFQCKLDKNQA